MTALAGSVKLDVVSFKPGRSYSNASFRRRAINVVRFYRIRLPANFSTRVDLK